jgi:hypothetical protein
LSNTSSIRVEILIPLSYNNGAEIEDDIFAIIHDELINRFRGYTQSIVPTQGIWQNPDGRRFHDNHRLVWIVCDNTPENIDFFQRFRRRLETLLEQESILC